VIIEIRMHEEDRKKLDIPGPEWLTLDFDWARDQPAERLVRWEAECGYSIERALNEAGKSMGSLACLVLIWVARKQGGLDAGGRTDDGDPEPFAALKDVRTMRVDLRNKKAADADPPAEASGPSSSSEDDGSATS